MRLTSELLQSAMAAAPALAGLYAPHLADACDAYEINTAARLAAFLAQIGHESGSLRWVREIWGPTAAQGRYEGRADLGNTQPGDGRKFAGHGLIQTTGRFNHRAVRDRLRARGIDCPDFEAAPDLLAEPKWAAWSAADYWGWKNCNALADAGDFDAITRAINGGLNGKSDRDQRWERAKAALAAAPAPAPAPAPPAPTDAWRSDDPAQYSQEAGMPIPALIPALAKAFLPALLTEIPRLAEMFGKDSEVSQRNVAAVGVALDIVKNATSSINEQEAITKIQSDPAAKAAATKAVEDHWFEIHKAREDSTAAARKFSVEYAANSNVRTVVGNLTFLELLSLFLVTTTLLGGIAVLIWGGIDAQLKGAVVTLMLIGGFTGVVQFWFGSSLGSKKKDDRPPTA